MPALISATFHMVYTYSIYSFTRTRLIASQHHPRTSSIALRAIEHLPSVGVTIVRSAELVRVPELVLFAVLNTMWKVALSADGQ